MGPTKMTKQSQFLVTTIKSSNLGDLCPGLGRGRIDTARECKRDRPFCPFSNEVAEVSGN